MEEKGLSRSMDREYDADMKREQYAKQGDDGETQLDVETISKKLTQDLRRDVNQHVRSCSFLSSEWMMMADTIARLGKITSLEATTTRFDADKKSKAGKHVVSIPTLWECGEAGIRSLVEDGKMNLLLKVLSDFKISEQELKSRGDRERKRAARYKFELGIGQTFINAWRHREVIQIMDITFLLSYIAGILDYVIKDSMQLNEIIESLSLSSDVSEATFSLLSHGNMDREGEEEEEEEEEEEGRIKQERTDSRGTRRKGEEREDEIESEERKNGETITNSSGNRNKEMNLAFRYRQEYLAIIYIGYIINHAEETMRERIGYLMRENKILELVASFASLLPSLNASNQDEVYEIIKAMNLICSTEDFEIYQNDYLTPRAKNKLQECHEQFIKQYAKKVGFQGRKLIRPLLDACFL